MVNVFVSNSFIISFFKRCRALQRRISVWILSIVAVVLVPCLPLFVEGVKNHWVVKAESFLLTGAVLSAGYGFSSEGNIFRSAYLCTFLLCIVFDYKPEELPNSLISDVGANISQRTNADYFSMIVQSMGRHPALMIVILIGILHAIERFKWHVVLDRRFPDWIREA